MRTIATALLLAILTPVIALAYTIQTTALTAGLLGIAAPTPIRVGQTFTTVGAGNLTQVQILLDNCGTSPADNTTADIYAVDASHLPTGSSLSGQATFPNASLTSSPVMRTFTFTPFAVNASTEYAIVIGRSGAPSGTNFACIDGANSNDYANGTALRDNAGTWATLTQDDGAIITISAAAGSSYIIDTF